jgi:hypothetical protein
MAINNSLYPKYVHHQFQGPFSEQKVIAAALSDDSSTIGRFKRIIAKKKVNLRGVMDVLLTLQIRL